jgi:hypothetical protein
MPARYHFISTFSLTSEIEAVWGTLLSIEAWPTWWKGLRRVDVVRAGSGGGGVGAIYRNHVRAPSGYRFVYDTEVVETERLRRIDVRSSGDIVGRGRFLLAEAPHGGTDVSFAWLVETPKWWMSMLAPIARPAFTWNHDRLMTDFGRGLAATSGGELAAVANRARSPGDPQFHVMPEPTA